MTPTAHSAWAFPFGYLGEEVLWTKDHFMENCLKSSEMKLWPLSVISISGGPFSLKIVFRPKITVSNCMSGKGPSHMKNEK